MPASLILQALRPATTTTSCILRRVALPAAASAASTRPLHTTVPTRLPYKNSQDRESIGVDRGDETQSGRTSDVVAREDASFNPKRTNPKSEKESAHDNGNPLEVSGANPDVSEPQGAEKEASAKAGAGEEMSKGAGGGKASRAGKSPKGSSV
jgi:hypothetical protein